LDFLLTEGLGVLVEQRKDTNVGKQIMVCGVDCHRGDKHCNGYCYGEAPQAADATPEMVLAAQGRGDDLHWLEQNSGSLKYRPGNARWNAPFWELTFGDYTISRLTPKGCIAEARAILSHEKPRPPIRTGGSLNIPDVVRRVAAPLQTSMSHDDEGALD
jgi:hypothetical protein